MAAVTAIMPGTAGTAGTAFESWAARASAVRTTIGTATTAVWAATAAAITSAALWTLETGTRIAADAGGIPREIFARSSGAADARGSRFAGKQDDVVFDDGWSRGDFSCVRFDQFCFGMFMFGVLMLGMSVFRESVHGVLGITESGGVFGAFVRGVGCEFGAVGGAMLFDFFGFILGEFGLRGSLIFGGVEVRFFLALFFLGFFVLRQFSFASGVNFLGFVIFFKFGAAYEGIGLDVIGGFLMFCLHELGRKGHNLVFAQFAFAARGHGF
jgi:hypothetical protein